MIKDDSKAKCEIIVKDEDSILSDNDIGHVVVPVLHFKDAPIDRWFEINAPPLQHVTGTSSPPPFPSLFLFPLPFSPLSSFPPSPPFPPPPPFPSLLLSPLSSFSLFFLLSPPPCRFPSPFSFPPSYSSPLSFCLFDGCSLDLGPKRREECN